jgi:hypothetical protein
MLNITDNNGSIRIYLTGSVSIDALSQYRKLVIILDRGRANDVEFIFDDSVALTIALAWLYTMIVTKCASKNINYRSTIKSQKISSIIAVLDTVAAPAILEANCAGLRAAFA